jgi:flagellar protein FlaG
LQIILTQSGCNPRPCLNAGKNMGIPRFQQPLQPAHERWRLHRGNKDFSRWLLPLSPAATLGSLMAIPTQPNIKLVNAAGYRENYANSVQIRVNVWDFFLVFGTLQQQSESQVEIRNFQGIYLSPQQAKALLGLLQQNVAGYESAFGEIKLDPRMTGAGQVH